MFNKKAYPWALFVRNAYIFMLVSAFTLIIIFKWMPAGSHQDHVTHRTVIVSPYKQIRQALPRQHVETVNNDKTETITQREVNVL